MPARRSKADRARWSRSEATELPPLPDIESPAPLPDWRPRKGLARLVVEVRRDALDDALRRANARGVPLARLVEEGLRAAGAVGLAALIVALGGCHSESAALPACEVPAPVPCEVG